MKEDVIKNITEGYSKSIKEMWDDYVVYISNIKTICVNTPSFVKKQKNGNSIEIKQSPESNTKLCKMIEETKEWTKWIGDVSLELANIPINSVGFLCRATGESLEYALSIVNNGVEFSTNWLTKKMSNLTVNSKWLKKLVKTLKKIILYIKKSIKTGELFIYKTTKKVLNFAANNKVTDALSKAYSSVFNFIESISKYIDITLETIEGLLSTLVGFNLDGETMGFFITPKTVMAGFAVPDDYTTMKPLNFEKSIKTNISDEEVEGLKENYRKEKINKSEKKKVKISAYIQENVNRILNSDESVDIPDIEIEKDNTDDFSNLMKKIALVVSLSIQPEPLPKYERLHPANIGYMTWLITSFEPTMKKCFGLPTFP